MKKSKPETVKAISDAARVVVVSSEQPKLHPQLIEVPIPGTPYFHLEPKPGIEPEKLAVEARAMMAERIADLAGKLSAYVDKQRVEQLKREAEEREAMKRNKGAAEREAERAERERLEHEPISTSELPEDMRNLIAHLWADMCGKVAINLPTTLLTTRLYLTQLPAEIKLLPSPKAKKTDKKKRKGVSTADARGEAHAVALSKVEGDTLPPIIIVGDKWLDGQHRVVAARLRGDKKITAIDLKLIEPHLDYPANLAVLGVVGPKPGFGGMAKPKIESEHTIVGLLEGNTRLQENNLRYKIVQHLKSIGGSSSLAALEAEFGEKTKAAIGKLRNAGWVKLIDAKEAA